MDPKPTGKCELCGEPMPPGEEMFKFHGLSGPCPKPPLPKSAPEERMLKWFEFAHLPDHLKLISSYFYDVACQLIATVEPGPERTVAFRKLLEAKDAAVRAKVHPGG